LREHLTLAPVLTQPNMTKPFEVFCDSSGTSLVPCFCRKDGLLPMPHKHFDLLRRIILPMILS
jgi:hypothetical protein